MDVVKKIREKASKRLRTIALPEYDDARVVEASKIIEKQGIAKVILLTEDKIIPRDKARYVDEFYSMHKAKGISVEDVMKLFEGTLYYACMMAREGKVDGVVAGASHTTPDMARAAIRCLGVDERLNLVSSCFIMVVPDSTLGEEGTFIFADCGIVPEPNSRQLAYIALSAAELGEKVLEISPRVALLSYSTKGSSKGKAVEKISEALTTLKTLAPELLVDGEMQVDAAIVPEVAKIKCPASPLGGKANVLIFPSLEAGNISYKLVQRLARARALGPLLMGLNKPASDLSRGCSVEDIVDCAAITALRAQ